jgi:hypothetical protein
MKKRTRLGHVLKRQPSVAPAARWRQPSRRMGSVRPIGSGKYLRRRTWVGGMGPVVCGPYRGRGMELIFYLFTSGLALHATGRHQDERKANRRY